MKIYLAGAYTKNPEESVWDSQITNRLLTYFEKPILGQHYQSRSLFLDSGAYSAWSKNGKIDIQEYIRFIKLNEHLIDVYANLDVIGDTKQCWRNQKIMERAGLHPLPVYHVQDDLRWLEKCKHEYEHFCIGGMAKGFTTHSRTGFLDRCFQILCDGNGTCENKVHGFGMTAFTLMKRYPWYSVDSTAWLMTSANGSILVPKMFDGSWCFSERDYKVTVSAQSPSVVTRGAHYETLLEKEKELVRSWLSHIGIPMGSGVVKSVDSGYVLQDNERWICKETKSHIYSIEEKGVCNDYRLRNLSNIRYYQQLEKYLTERGASFTRAHTIKPLV